MRPFLIVTTLAVIAAAAHAAGYTGLTMERCTSNSQCRTGRVCVDLNAPAFTPIKTPSTACLTSSSCVCMFPNSTSCNAATTCDIGEVCARIRKTPFRCVSCQIAFFGFETVDGFAACKNTGVTLEVCREASCQTPRTCFKSDFKGPCAGGSNCRCAQKDIPCTSCDVCPNGESCFRIKKSTTSICFASGVGEFNSNIEKVGKCTKGPTTTPGPDGPDVTDGPDMSEGPLLPTQSSLPDSELEASPPPPPPPVAQSVSPTLAPSPSTSASVTTVSATASVSVTVPVAATKSISATPSAATSGSTTPSSTSTPSLSTSVSPTPTATPVCIATKHLGGLSRSALVFAEDVQAEVLCDESGSCATSGHMVVFKGRAMRMRSYCELGEVNCQRSRMTVNSPRMRLATRVASNTKALLFTAMAARYDSRAEEVVLRALVHAGL